MKFFGQKMNHAFHPVYSGSNTYHVYVHRYQHVGDGAIVTTTSGESFWRSVDDCIQWALMKLIPAKDNAAVYAVIFNAKGEMVKSYMSTDDIIKDLWKCMKALPLMDGNALDTNWFIFPKGTAIEDIWHWMDEQYSRSITELLGRN